MPLILRTSSMISAFTIISSASSIFLPLRSALCSSLVSSAFFFLIADLNSSSTFEANRGFARKLSTPALTASSIISSQLYAVRMMIAESVPAIDLIAFVVCIPSISGIFQSTRIRLYGSCLASRTLTMSTAFFPERAISQEIPTLSSTSLACSHATSSSSTTSTERSCVLISASCSPLSVLPESKRVTVTVNVVPFPFSLSTLILPFIISTILLVIARPSPVLPYLLDTEESS